MFLLILNVNNFRLNSVDMELAVSLVRLIKTKKITEFYKNYRKTINWLLISCILSLFNSKNLIN